MAHHTFISYSTHDKHIADEMCTVLESQNISCWIAPRDILPGADWGGAIIDAITTSRVMVLLLSANSNKSSQVLREVERAVNKGVIVIPFRIEDITLSKSLEYHLSVTHWMDALTTPMDQYFQRLAERIRQILAIESSVGSVPIQNPERTPIRPIAPPKKRTALYVGIGLAIGLIALVSVVLFLVTLSPTKTVVKADTETPPSPTPTPSPSGRQNNPRDTGPNNNQTPNNNSDSTGDRLRIPVITGVDYDTARKLLIKEGWQPNEKHISYGDDAKVQSGNGPTFWKRGYRELDSCAGSALAECIFEFIDPNARVLVVITQGEEDDGGKYHAVVKRVGYKRLTLNPRLSPIK
jgi:hypothetical protein